MSRQTPRKAFPPPPDASHGIDSRPTMPEADVPPEGLPHDYRAELPSATMPDGTAERRRIGDFQDATLIAELAKRGFTVSRLPRSMTRKM